jgi:hypothetical protein
MLMVTNTTNTLPPQCDVKQGTARLAAALPADVRLFAAARILQLLQQQTVAGTASSHWSST